MSRGREGEQKSNKKKKKKRTGVEKKVESSSPSRSRLSRAAAREQLVFSLAPLLAAI